MRAVRVGWGLLILVYAGVWGEPDARKVVADPAESVEARLQAWERIARGVRRR